MKNVVVSSLAALSLLASSFGLALAAAPPSVQSVQPAAVTSTGGAEVSITGRKFQPGATVLFGTIPAANVTFSSDSRLEVITPLTARGTVDVTVTNPDGRSSTWAGFDFLHDGNGMFEFQGDAIPSDHVSSYDVDLGDIDGDGDLDFMVTSQNGYHALYRNDGAGVFSDITSSNLPPAGFSSYDVEFGDADRDSDLDIILTSSSQVYLYLNDGTGDYSDFTTTNMPVDAYAGNNTLEFGDVDGDNDLDIVVANSTQDKLLLNDGSGVFSDATATNMPVESYYSNGVQLGDVDGDGDLDIFVANSGNGPNGLYLNNGAGAFSDASSTNLPPGTANYSSIGADFGDVDGDNDLDIIVNNIGSPNPNKLYLNNGSGVFADVSGTSLPGNWNDSMDAEFGDMDGDGDLDIVCANYNRQQNRLYENDGTGVFIDVTTTNLPADNHDSREADFGDVDGDGDLDIILANHGTFGTGAEQTRLYRNDGTGSFADGTLSSLPGDNDKSYDVGFGDVNNDGHLDAYIANDDSYSIAGDRLYLNDGNGNLVEASAGRLPPSSDSSYGVLLGDVDNDDDLDIIVANFSGQQNRLYLNDGTGVFSDATSTNLPPDSDSSYDAALGDVNGDGADDVVLANYLQNRLYLNNGAGSFVDVTTTAMPVDSDNTRGVSLNDVDSDGDLDMLLVNYALQNRLYLNDGSGSFDDATSTRLPALVDSSNGVDGGDVDGDGDIDFIVANYSGSNVLYLNDGSGTFSDGTAQLPWGSSSNGVAFADVDGDGDLDIAFATNSGQNQLFTNDGTGTFTFATSTNLPFNSQASYAVAFGDVDGDYDLDFVTANNGQNRIYTNVEIADTEPPSTPANLMATTVACDQIDLTWTDSSDNVGVAGYTVYRDGVEVGAVPGTSYSDTGLMENTAYTYTVDAYDAAGNRSAPSSPTGDTTTACGTCSDNEKSLCGDNIDNDCDGLVDCDDRDCRRDSLCELPPEICDDGIDNDGDGKTDCDDNDCRRDPACP